MIAKTNEGLEFFRLGDQLVIHPLRRGARILAYELGRRLLFHISFDGIILEVTLNPGESIVDLDFDPSTRTVRAKFDRGGFLEDFEKNMQIS